MRRPLLLIASLGLILSPLAINSSAMAHLPQADVSLQQFTFVPSLSVMELTAFAQTAMPTTAPLPTPFPTPVMMPIENDEFAVAGDLEINGEAYPIGDKIPNADEIPLGATEEGSFGEYGYAVVRDHPEYRLLWTTDEDGARHHIIVHENDPLFAGDDGFRKHLDDLQAGMTAMVSASVPVFTAGATLFTIGLGACAPTAGAGCAVAFIGAGIAGVVGLGVMGYVRSAVVNPAIDNLTADFSTIAPNRGVDSQR